MMDIEDIRKELLNIKIDMYDQYAESNDESIWNKINAIEMAYDILCEIDNM